MPTTNVTMEITLDSDFVDTYRSIEPPFGFDGLGAMVYRRTYARLMPNGELEQWVDTVERVVNGTMNKLLQHMRKTYGEYTFTEDNITRFKDMFDRIFRMKFTPPGRGLWAMGTDIVMKDNINSALYNCAFVSTQDMRRDNFADPFCWLMNNMMLGVGVGFDVLGAANGVKICKRPSNSGVMIVVIPDSREGWVDSVRQQLMAAVIVGARVEFNYDNIRPKGVPLKRFGGVASGPQPLKDLHDRIDALITQYEGRKVDGRFIMDVMNMIGCCVVAGNVRRSAEIAFSQHNDIQFLNMKNYEVNPDRIAWGWASNNTVWCDNRTDYEAIAEHIRMNGEPGCAWLHNMRRYGRMDGSAVTKDQDPLVAGGNPCLEQSLEHMEMCCLVETFPHHHTDFRDYARTLESALWYGKIVSTCMTGVPATDRVMARNRRIGVSMTGIAQFLGEKRLCELRQWCKYGYHTLKEADKCLSKFLGIPKSIKLTSIKPSGTVSLLAGATPGMHFPISRYCIRRVNVPKDSLIANAHRDAGYMVEASAYSPETSEVVEFVIDHGKVKTVEEVGMEYQFMLASFLQEFWADNQVSCTVTFDEATEGHKLGRTLEMYATRLKGISCLPKGDAVYEQMPYQAITDTEYFTRLATHKPVDYSQMRTELGDGKLYCDGEKCIVYNQ